MTKEQQAQRLLNNFDLRLSWLFSPDKISMKCEDDGIRYEIKGAKNGSINLHARKVLKHGVPACIDVFGRFENGIEFFPNANKFTGKYNFFNLDKDGTDYYLNTIIKPLAA